MFSLVRVVKSVFNLSVVPVLLLLFIHAVRPVAKKNHHHLRRTASQPQGIGQRSLHITTIITVLQAPGCTIFTPW